MTGGFAWDEINIYFGRSGFLPFHEFNFHRPLFTSILALEWAVFRDAAAAYHLLNSLLHAANSVLVLFVARRLLQSGTAALISALVFALHPVNSEAVAWVLTGSELVKTFFLLASFHLYLLYREDRRLPGLVAAALFYLLACLGGQGALVFPIVIICYEILLGDGAKGVRLPAAAYGAMAAVYIAGFSGAGEITSVAVAPGISPYDAVVSLGYYAFKLVIPVGIEFLPVMQDYPHYLIFALLLLALPFIIKRRGGNVEFLLLYVLVMLIPALLIAMSGTAYPLGVRYVYAASAGVAMLAGHFLSMIPRRGVLIAAVSVLAVLLAAGSLQRAFVWSDRVGLWTEAASGSSGNPMKNINLAAALISAGRQEEAVRPLKTALSSQAISSVEFRRAMKLLYAVSPGDDDEMYSLLSDLKGPSKAYLGMGFYYLDRYTESEPRDRDLLGKAIRFLGNAVQEDKNLLMARQYLGVSYLHAGMYDEAITELMAVNSLDRSGRYASEAQSYLGQARLLKTMETQKAKTSEPVKRKLK